MNNDPEASPPPAEEPNEIEQLEEADQFSDDSNESPPSDIVAYNELRSGADILRMYDSGELEIQPDFQRDVVWSGVAMTRFVDSLVKQLPIPSMCFAFDYKQNKWIVIDGLQRISTIVRLLSGSNWRLSKLDDVDPALAGKNAADLKNATGDQRIFYSRIQNQMLPINVLRCDFKKRSHNEYLFTIFHRLNSGGTKLNNQEIRNCIYSGKLNDLLKDLDVNNEGWRRINRMNENENYRFVKQEVILRFYAFLERQDAYKGSVAKFLNSYMNDFRNPSQDKLTALRSIFTRTVSVMDEKIFQPNVLRVPNTVLEAAMIGIACNIDRVDNMEAGQARQKFRQFIEDESVSAAYLAEGLSKKDKVDARLNAAKRIFAA